MSVLEAPVRPGTNDHAKFFKLVGAALKHPPATTAVAHPCDQVSLESVVEAARLKLIEPILVGPRDRIESVARKFDLDISPFEIVDALAESWSIDSGPRGTTVSVRLAA